MHVTEYLSYKLRVVSSIYHVIAHILLMSDGKGFRKILKFRKMPGV